MIINFLIYKLLCNNTHSIHAYQNKKNNIDEKKLYLFIN